MKGENAGNKYYATEIGTPVLEENVAMDNGRYVLATVSIESEGIAFDCTYTYDIKAEVAKTIADGSDDDVLVVLTNSSGLTESYTLKELTTGVVYEGNFTNLQSGSDQEILIESYEAPSPVAKIGLMYVSDYILSLGEKIFTLTDGTYTNRTLLSTGWIHHYKGIWENANDWLIRRQGVISSIYRSWAIGGEGNIRGVRVDRDYGVRPVFYLTSDVVSAGGDGTYFNPFIIKNQ